MNWLLSEKKIFRYTHLIVFAITCFSLAVSGELSGDYIHYQLGVKYKNEKKYNEAIDEFRKVLAAYPDNYNAYMHLAEIRTEQNQHRLVIYNLKKALGYNPGWGKAHKLLASAYEKDGQVQKAVLELQQYLPTSDPAERDSLQKQIDRMIKKIGGGQTQPDSQKVISSQDRKNSSDVSKTESKAAEPVQKMEPAKKELPKQNTAAGTPSDSAAFATAVSLYNDKKYDAAMEQIRKVLTIQPNHSGAYYYAGLIRRRNGQTKMAKINFQKAIDYPELGYNAHFYLGKIYAEENNYQEAINQLLQYISKSSYEPGKKEALALIEQLKKKSPGTPVVPVKAGSTPSAPAKKDSTQEITFSVQNAIPKEKYVSFEIAIDSMLSMLAIDTLSDPGQQLLYGIREFLQGGYDKSILEFKKVMSTNPSAAVAVPCIYNTGVCYFKLGLFKEAENQFQLILERYSNHKAVSKAMLLKAFTYAERRDLKNAERLIREFLQTYRDHEWRMNAFEKLGDTYIQMEQPGKAIDAYTQAGNALKVADRVRVLFKLGTTYLHLGNSKRAIESFRSVISIGEKGDVYVRVPDAYYRIGDEYYKSKEYDKALEFYIKVTRKYPAFQETPWGYFQIGSILKNQKRYQEAVKMFKELIRKFPEDYWAKQAQWKLDDTIWENEYNAVLR
ncbi:MAG: tetratricopeptide repeat protein [Fibrobacter sp.]|nr:tetratricopeptide repeat protein [Fibrobacter sp.]